MSFQHLHETNRPVLQASHTAFVIFGKVIRFRNKKNFFVIMKKMKNGKYSVNNEEFKNR